jgi:hypothetical protein
MNDEHPMEFTHITPMSDLENAISNHKKAVELANDGQPYKAMYLLNLGISQQTHFNSPYGNMADLAASIISFKTAAQLNPHTHIMLS